MLQLHQPNLDLGHENGVPWYPLIYPQSHGTLFDMATSSESFDHITNDYLAHF